MTMAIEMSTQTVTAIKDAAARMINVGVRELAEPLRAGYPLNAEEVFAFLNHPGFASAVAILEVKHGGDLFSLAREGQTRKLGDALSCERGMLAKIAREIGE